MASRGSTQTVTSDMGTLRLLSVILENISLSYNDIGVEMACAVFFSSDFTFKKSY